MPQGDNDHNRIRYAALKSDFCVSVLCPENINSPWINFEAGLFCNRGEVQKYDEVPSLVHTMLIGGLDYKTLKKENHPLSQIYHCQPLEQGALLGFLETVYNKYTNPALRKPTKSDAFKKFIDSAATKKLLKYAAKNSKSQK